MNSQYFSDVNDVAEILGISKACAYKIVHRFNDEKGLSLLRIVSISSIF